MLISTPKGLHFLGHLLVVHPFPDSLSSTYGNWTVLPWFFLSHWWLPSVFCLDIKVCSENILNWTGPGGGIFEVWVLSQNLTFFKWQERINHRNISEIKGIPLFSPVLLLSCSAFMTDWHLYLLLFINYAVILVLSFLVISFLIIINRFRIEFYSFCSCILSFFKVLYFTIHLFIVYWMHSMGWTTGYLNPWCYKWIQCYRRVWPTGGFQLEVSRQQEATAHLHRFQRTPEVLCNFYVLCAFKNSFTHEFNFKRES